MLLLLRLSTTMLLTATCLLLTADFSSAWSKKSVIICDDAIADASAGPLTCDYAAMTVWSAVYGRADTETCSEGRSPQQLADTTCSQDNALEIIKTECDGRKVCGLNMTAIRASDPCPGISKYLNITYSCVAVGHVTACEHSVAQLHCYDGQEISVYNSNYGRHQHHKCVDQRPYPQIKNVECINVDIAMPIVSERCNGKSSCVVPASNSVFGDLCLGTYKYLTVAFKCQYKIVACQDSEASLKCAEGKRIFVYTAVYGRSDQTTCASGRLESEIQDVRCSRFTSKVAESCNGENSCVVSVSNAEFGDPCVGTYKYLTVGYTCYVSA